MISPEIFLTYSLEVLKEQQNVARKNCGCYGNGYVTVYRFIGHLTLDPSMAAFLKAFGISAVLCGHNKAQPECS